MRYLAKKLYGLLFLLWAAGGANAAERLAACDVLTGLLLGSDHLLLVSARGDVLTQDTAKLLNSKVAQCEHGAWFSLAATDNPAWTGIKKANGEIWLLGHQESLYRLMPDKSLRSHRHLPTSSRGVMDMLVAQTADNLKRHYVVGTRGLYLLSEDGGDSWMPQDLYIDPEWEEPEDYNLNAIVQLSTGELLVAGELGSIYWSKDGEDWQKDAANTDATWFGAASLPNGGVLLFGFAGKIAYSEGYQQPWRLLASPVGHSLFAATQVDQYWLLAGANGSLVAVNPSAGMSLQEIPTGTTASITQLAAYQDKLVMSTDQGFWSMSYPRD
jgi:photosystem II stability/assembly factor-like uncharacterized protein